MTTIENNRAQWQERIERSLADTYLLPEGVRIWLGSRNTMLDLRIPQELIDEGEGERVYALTEFLADGGFA